MLWPGCGTRDLRLIGTLDEMTFKAPPTQSLCLKAESLTGQDRPPNAPMPTAPFSGRWGRVGEVGVMEPAQSPLLRDIPSSEATVIPCD